ncbi:hypothetical protein HPB52_018532 [Rhipicephalus sanguineus]|uniref:Uncharacterized protein n=1 Tax=Rhipicephalus sanguineus TaxID=34632 RepID=A0A9D4QEZ9_RHISA|nr:hypothetical protein HPB52_018532 [Rhipicephalus sanguineus]
MLRHYEKECTFHLAECSRCGEEVLHRDLARHYLAGCVVEHLGNQGSKLAATPGEVGESAQDSEEVATGVGAASTSTSLREATSRQCPSEEANKSTSSQSCPEKQIALKPHYFSHMPVGAVNDVHKITWQHLPLHYVVPGGLTRAECPLRLICDPSETTYTWREALSNGRYMLLLDSIHEDVPSQGEKGTTLCKVTVAHTRDSYLNLEVSQDVSSICLSIEFYGMLEGSPCPAPSFEVTSYDARRRHPFSFDSLEQPCHCKRKPDEESALHFHRQFLARRDTLEGDLFSGSLQFDIYYS